MAKLSLPETGFGTWKILLNGRAKHAVTEALEAGYRLIDTAMIYGNEKGVGAAVRNSKIPRKDIFLTTKLWNFDQGYDKAIDAFDTSLARLGIEYIDLYLIHWPQSTQQTKDSWRAMQEIQATGRAKYIGVSNYSVEELKDLLNFAEIPPAVNQIEFHPFVYKDQKPTLDYCRDQGIIVEAYSPLAHAKQMDHPAVVRIAKATTKTPGQVMLRWAVQHGTVPIPKTTHKERMQENLDIFNFELSKQQMAELDGLSDGASVI